MAASPLAYAAEQLEAEARAIGYLDDPTGWLADRLREHAWSKQREILGAVQQHRRTAVRSAHGVGKSHIASRVAAWWLDVHPPGSAFVVTTAPTYAQVRAILWRYIRQAHKRGGLNGKVNQTEWSLDGELVAFGRKPADHDEAAFQGIHARYVLVILDEAGGIPEDLWVAADALTTNTDCRILAIGNPDNPQSHFAKVSRPGSLWHTIRISAFDSPNLSGEQIPPELVPLLVSAEWVAEKAAEWGVDNRLYVAKVLGEFPDEDPTAVVRLSDVTLCRTATELPRTAAELLPVELGVDVGGGGDETVIRERRGPVAGREWRHHSDRPEDLAPLVVRAIKESDATSVKVDSIGIGAGLVGELRNLGRDGVHGALIVGVNVAEAATDSRFANLRAQIWWEIGRAHAEQRTWDLSGMANADTTVAQLIEPRWSTDTKGRIIVEPKDEIRKRLGRSPDNADALLLAFYVPPVAADPSDWLRRYAAARTPPQAP